MKTTILTILLAAAVLLAGCGSDLPTIPDTEDYPPQATLDAQSGYKQWSTIDQSIIITYPHRWFANEGATSAIVTLGTPVGDATPEYREYIAFGVQQPEEGQTEQYIADLTFTDMKQLLPDIELIHGSREYVAGYWMEYRVFGGHVNNANIGPEGEYVWYQYSFIASGMSYSITFACSKQLESTYKADFDYVLNNLILHV